MPYYATCPDCGAHLDPGEVCDCQDRTELLEKAFALLQRLNDEQVEILLHTIQEGV